jgi:hypothetical protein
MVFQKTLVIGTLLAVATAAWAGQAAASSTLHVQSQGMAAAVELSSEQADEIMSTSSRLTSLERRADGPVLGGQFEVRGRHIVRDKEAWRDAGGRVLALFSDDTVALGDDKIRVANESDESARRRLLEAVAVAALDAQWFLEDQGGRHVNLDAITGSCAYICQVSVPAVYSCAICPYGTQNGCQFNGLHVLRRMWANGIMGMAFPCAMYTYWATEGGPNGF